MRQVHFVAFLQAFLQTNTNLLGEQTLIKDVLCRLEVQNSTVIPHGSRQDLQADCSQPVQLAMQTDGASSSSDAILACFSVIAFLHGGGGSSLRLADEVFYQSSSQNSFLVLDASVDNAQQARANRMQKCLLPPLDHSEATNAIPDLERSRTELN